jgi:hypothetical protein
MVAAKWVDGVEGAVFAPARDVGDAFAVDREAEPGRRRCR